MKKSVTEYSSCDISILSIEKAPYVKFTVQSDASSLSSVIFERYLRLENLKTFFQKVRIKSEVMASKMAENVHESVLLCEKYCFMEKGNKLQESEIFEVKEPLTLVTAQISTLKDMFSEKEEKIDFLIDAFSK